MGLVTHKPAIRYRYLLRLSFSAERARKMMLFTAGTLVVEHFRNFLVRHSFVTAQHHGHPLVLREARDGRVNCLLQFCVHQPLAGRGRFEVGVLLMPGIILISFHRDQMCPPPPAHFVEDEIARDRHEPGREFCSGLVARGGFPNTDKYLLPNVLRVRRTA